MENKLEYKILVDAKQVAGYRNPGKGKPIFLTADQAAQPLRDAEVELIKVVESKKSDKKGSSGK